jgi:hypothetical protein
VISRPALAAIGLLAPVATALADRLYRPPAIVTPADMAIPAVEARLRQALVENEWLPKDAVDGRWLARRIEGGPGAALWDATIELQFDARSIRIVYRDSRGLDYDAARGEIDARYNRWLRRLERTIRRSLADP